ncbi:MAG TPA: pitrilysin family protein [Gemmatimonadaceae bacterium]|jgi:zinc protease|nr:pitrilysin family protein [Gemmatimonadaceae bacterium]
MRTRFLRHTLSGLGALALVVSAGPLAAQHSADTLTSDLTVDGLHIILRRNTANNVVAANLYLLGGTRQITPANAGIEPFLLDVSERGTQRYPQGIIQRKMSLLGTEITVAPSEDWTIFGIRSTDQAFDSTWAIFADRAMAPALRPADVELIRAQFLSAIQQKRDDPDDLVEALADSMAFVGHPYSVEATGTVSSLRAITAADLRAYHKSQFVKSRMLLVVVGNVTRAHLEKLVRATLAKLPLGTYHWTLPPPTPSLPAGVAFVQRSLPTNYILGYFSGPLASSPDYQNLRLAMTVLTGGMFSEIRSRENLTYDVHAPFLDRAATSGGLYVTTVSPDTTLKLMRLFVQQLQQATLTSTGLNRLELSFVTDYFLQNETNASQADFLARAQLYQGDYHHAMTFVDELRAVTPEDVQRAARLYIKNIRFAYVGDSTRVDRNLLEGF